MDGAALPVRIPRRVQTALIDGLQLLLPTGDKKRDGQIAKAVRSLEPASTRGSGPTTRI